MKDIYKQGLPAMVTKIGWILVLIACFHTVSTANTIEALIQTKRSAVTVSGVRLYADSSYGKPTEVLIGEGELVEVVAESHKEHYDNTQNQTFKWFKIKTLGGQMGWIFGDNLAVALPEQFVDYILKPFHKQKAHFDNGFEEAVIWIAATEGHDDKYKTKPFLNPPYKEFYLVITNSRGQCVQINYANVNESGRKELLLIDFKDITDNNSPEIIIESSSFPTGRNLDDRLLEIFSFKAGGLSKVFEERMTLMWSDDIASPAYSKFIEIEGSVIHVEYIDYVPCDKYRLGLPTDIRATTLERCLESVTYSYIWDKTERTFKILYPESRNTPKGHVERALPLQEAPQTTAAKKTALVPTERLQIIKHYDTIVIENGQKKAVNWLYVKNNVGEYGYVPAQSIIFDYCAHNPILHQYYEKPPLLKMNWRSEAPFVKITASE